MNVKLFVTHTVVTHHSFLKVSHLDKCQPEQAEHMENIKYDTVQEYTDIQVYIYSVRGLFNWINYSFNF